MLEISDLKAKKLPELQDLAKSLGVPKYRSLKKLDLVYQILDYQASNPNAVKALEKEDKNVNKVAQPDQDKGNKNAERAKQHKANKQHAHQRKAHSQNGQQAEKKSVPVEIKDTGNQPKEQQKKVQKQSQANEAKKKNPNANANTIKDGNKDTRNRYRQPDFEFEGIIESEGVLDIMQDGYGFLRSSDYNYLSSPDDDLWNYGYI